MRMDAEVAAIVVLLLAVLAAAWVFQRRRRREMHARLSKQDATLTAELLAEYDASEAALAREAAVAAAAASGLPIVFDEIDASAHPACYDVMISNRVHETGGRGDGETQALKAELEKYGYSVFVGEEIPAGANWPRHIQWSIENCRAFVIMCSPSYGDSRLSPWTKRELELADSRNRPMIPVWHSGKYPPGEVALFLTGLQRLPADRPTMRAGYKEAGISTQEVAAELVTALTLLGVGPSGNKSLRGGFTK
jgi:hypothetical protein